MSANGEQTHLHTFISERSMPQCQRNECKSNSLSVRTLANWKAQAQRRPTTMQLRMLKRKMRAKLNTRNLAEYFVELHEFIGRKCSVSSVSSGSCCCYWTSHVDKCSGWCKQRLTVNAIAAELASCWLNRCCAAAQQTHTHAYIHTCGCCGCGCARGYACARLLVVLVWSLHWILNKSKWRI